MNSSSIHVRLITLLLLTLSIPSLHVRAQSLAVKITEVDLSQFPSVHLHLDVKHDNITIPNLNSLLYELTENGVNQNIIRVDCALDSSTRLSIGLLIDRSGSMAQKSGPSGSIFDPDSAKIRAAKAAVRVFLDKLGSTDEAAIFSFSSSGISRFNFFDVNQDFTKNVTSLKNSLVPIKAEGGTYLWRAVSETISRTKLRQGKKFIIVMTDGRSDRQNDDKLQSAINNALAARIPIYTAGLGDDVSINELTEIANKTGGKFYKAPVASTLESIYLEIAKDIITDGCELQYTSSDACLDGTRRNLDLTVRGNSIYAEADTFFIVPKSLSTYTIAAESNLQVTSGEKIEVPVFLREILSDQKALRFDITLRYDPSLLTAPKLNLKGTMSEGSALTLQEITPGQLRLSLQDYLPQTTSGTLFRIEFTSQFLKQDTVARIDVINVMLSQDCPTNIVLENGDVLIHPCYIDFTLTPAAPEIINQNSEFVIPFSISPAPRFGEPFTLSFDFIFDPLVLDFLRVRTANTQAENFSVNAALIGNRRVQIRMSGIVNDITRKFLDVLFTSKQLENSQASEINISSINVLTNCISTLLADRISFFVNGACQKIARATTKKAFLSSSPNPFNPTTQLRFNILRDEKVKLDIFDAAGRHIKTLLDRTLGTGEYIVPFDASAFPSSYYFALLDAAGQKRIHRIILLR